MHARATNESPPAPPPPAVIPAGGLVAAGLLSALPHGMIFIVPGLVLVPYGTLLTEEVIQVGELAGGEGASLVAVARLVGGVD